MDITKAELMEKYEIGENALSMVVARIKPTGERVVNRHKLKLFDEGEAVKAILNLLQTRKDRAQKEYDEARGRYMRAFEIARASGLIDKPFPAGETRIINRVSHTQKVQEEQLPGQLMMQI